MKWEAIAHFVFDMRVFDDAIHKEDFYVLNAKHINRNTPNSDMGEIWSFDFSSVH